MMETIVLAVGLIARVADYFFIGLFFLLFAVAIYGIAVLMSPRESRRGDADE
jgi:phage shock protein PspC (stress-responsive transcriptional regulator)